MTRMQAMMYARDMWDNGHGWSYSSITRHLNDRGHRVTRRTVTRWVNEAYADADRKRQRKRCTCGARILKYLDEDAAYARITALDGMGIPASVIARLMAFDHGVQVTRNQVLYMLAAGRPTRGLREALAMPL